MKLNRKKSIYILTIICFMVLGSTTVFAEKIQDSVFFKGSMNLIKDATTALMIIAPIVGIALGVFFYIKKGGADEMDQKTWQKRINNTIYSVLGAELFSIALNLIVSYYK